MPTGIYKRIKLPWNKGLAKELQPRFGKITSKETKRKISKALTGRKLSEEHRKKCASFGMSGKKQSEKQKRVVGQVNSKKMIRKWEDKEYREKQVKAQTKYTPPKKEELVEKYIDEKLNLGRIGKIYSVSWGTVLRWLKEYNIPLRTREELWRTPEYVRNQMKARNVTPNKTELFLNKFLQKLLPKEYKYVGDGEFIIAGKCPDFINVNGQKKIIELYGDYWHRGETGEDRIGLFRQYGYETLIVWEKELEDRKLLKDKILRFHRL